MAKDLVYVLVPYSVGASDVSEHAAALLQRHAMPDDRSRGWYDYLCGLLEPAFDDPVTEGGLPDKQKRSLHRRVCDVSRLPTEPQPTALVTPDGVWHADRANIHEFRGPEADYLAASAAALASWPARYAELVAVHPYCWVVAILAHS